MVYFENTSRPSTPTHLFSCWHLFSLFSDFLLFLRSCHLQIYEFSREEVAYRRGENLCQLCIRQRINIYITESTQEAKPKHLMEVFLSAPLLGCWRAEGQHTLLMDQSLTAQIGPLKKALHVLMDVCVCTLARARMCLPMSEDGLLESLLFFHYIGPRDGPQVTLLGIKGLLSLR